MIRNVVVGRLRHAEDPGRRAADAAKICEDIARVQFQIDR
jgi:hypothetical protein